MFKPIQYTISDVNPSLLREPREVSLETLFSEARNLGSYGEIRRHMILLSVKYDGEL